MEYVKGSVIHEQKSYEYKIKNGKTRKYTQELYHIIITEENIFNDQDKVIIMRENDFESLSDLNNKLNTLEAKNNDLKSIINDLKKKINILEEYNRYLELNNKEKSLSYKSNYFTQ